MPEKLLPDATTQAAIPSWIQNAVGPISTTTEPGARLPSNLPAENPLAYVDLNQKQAQIHVVVPGHYTKPVAEHEGTHLFQGTRNDNFQDLTGKLLPPGPITQQDYDYGGVKQLQAHPQRSIATYNPEQQAQMVEDLATAQENLKPHMTVPQLQKWDAAKTALERPIRQLQAVAPRETGIGGAIDHYMHVRGFGDPVSYVKTFLGLDGIHAPIANPVPSAPSVALGYANPSKLVR